MNNELDPERPVFIQRVVLAADQMELVGAQDAGRQIGTVPATGGQCEIDLAEPHQVEALIR